jgi:hypothetical protein
MSIKEGKTVSESKTEADPKHTFPTYTLCMKEIDEQLALWEWQGLVQRVGKYEIRSNTRCLTALNGPRAGNAGNCHDRPRSPLLALAPAFRYFPPAVAKVYIVSFRTYDNRRSSKFIVLPTI